MLRPPMSWLTRQTPYLCYCYSFCEQISKDKSKPVIWIDAGIHAREWIAPAAALYFVDRVSYTGRENSYYIVELFTLSLRKRIDSRDKTTDLPASQSTICSISHFKT